MYVYNSCKYDKYETSMHGAKHIGCVHPKRKNLDSFLDKVLRIFSSRRMCAAKLGYESYCPYYEDKYTNRPSINPFSNETTLLDRRINCD